MSKKRFSGFRQGLRKAFSLQSPHGPLTDDDRQWIGKLAKSIVQRGCGTLWIFGLTAHKPIGPLISQAMVFARPFQEPISWLLYLVKPLLNKLVDVNLLFGQADYDRLTAILDRRDGVETMIEAIEKEQEHK